MALIKPHFCACILATIAFVMHLPRQAVAASLNKLPPEIYFSTGWCPRPEELAELSKYLDISMNGCCIKKGIPNALAHDGPDALEPWRNRMISNVYQYARCDGRVLTIQEETEAQKAYDEQIKQNEEQVKIDKERLLRNAPAKFQEMRKEEFCDAFGKAIRGVWIDNIGASKEVIVMARTEATRRKLSFNQNLVRAEKVRIGITECELYASWGLPERQSRSVGSWGVHIQHIFGLSGPYVYTQNGIVRSWQD